MARVFLIALLVSTLIAAPSLAFNEPADFRGAKWGCSPAEMGPLLPELLETKGAIRDDARVKYYFAHSQIGSISVVLNFTFLDNKFSAVWFTFNPGDFNILEGAFSDKYGKATKIDESTVKTRAGVEYSGRRLYWLGKEVSIRLSRYSEKVTEGSAVLTTSQMRSYLASRRNDATRDAAKDL